MKEIPHASVSGTPKIEDMRFVVSLDIASSYITANF